MSTWTG